jgi:hypothetical protein
MVGNPAIRQAMRRVVYAVLDVDDPTKDKEESAYQLRWMIECLADELRLALEASWGNIPKPGETASSVGQSLPSGCKEDRNPPPPVQTGRK